jgi:hypothetical protein
LTLVVGGGRDCWSAWWASIWAFATERRWAESFSWGELVGVGNEIRKGGF